MLSNRGLHPRQAARELRGVEVLAPAGKQGGSAHTVQAVVCDVLVALPADCNHIVGAFVAQALIGRVVRLSCSAAAHLAAVASVT